MRDRDTFWKAVREELATYTGKKLEDWVKKYNESVPEEYKLIPKEPNMFNSTPPTLAKFLYTKHATVRFSNLTGKLVEKYVIYDYDNYVKLISNVMVLLHDGFQITNIDMSFKGTRLVIKAARQDHDGMPEDQFLLALYNDPQIKTFFNMACIVVSIDENVITDLKLAESRYLSYTDEGENLDKFLRKGKYRLI